MRTNYVQLQLQMKPSCLGGHLGMAIYISVVCDG